MHDSIVPLPTQQPLLLVCCCERQLVVRGMGGAVRGAGEAYACTMCA